MREKTRNTILRLAVHLLLAAFLANAANKFFVADLDYELANGFYAKIFEGVGDAPDQYRILPLGPLKLLCDYLPFNHAVLVYNLFFSFLVFELFWLIMGGLSRSKKFTFNALFGLFYIFAQYSGWRPDTMGLMLVSALLALPGIFLTGENPNFKSVSRSLAISLLLIGLAFSRADIALFFAVLFAIYQTKSWALRLLWVGIPLATQFVLQEFLFPEAEYYSEKIMLWANLSGYYFARHPASYLFLALILAFWKPIGRFLRSTWSHRWFYLLLLGYLGLVLVIGRLNEYRLYLPFVPIFLVIWRDKELSHGTTTDSI